jgi:hypothetical protein
MAIFDQFRNTHARGSKNVRPKDTRIVRSTQYRVRSNRHVEARRIRFQTGSRKKEGSCCSVYYIVGAPNLKYFQRRHVQWSKMKRWIPKNKEAVDLHLPWKEVDCQDYLSAGNGQQGCQIEST